MCKEPSFAPFTALSTAEWLVKGATGDLLLIFLLGQKQIPLDPPLTSHSAVESHYKGGGQSIAHNGRMTEDRILTAAATREDDSIEVRFECRR